MTIKNSVDQFVTDSDIAHRIVHGPAGEEVITEGGPVPTMATALKGMTNVKERVDALYDGQSAAQIVKGTWAELAAVATSASGTRGAQVFGDTDTHSDPVTGVTVPNAGQYMEAPQGWRWLQAHALSSKASIEDVARLATNVGPAIAQADKVAHALRSGTFVSPSPRDPTNIVAAAIGYGSWTQAFDVGVDVMAGTIIDGVRAQLEVTGSARSINVDVWRRPVGDSAQDRAGPGRDGDVLVASGGVDVARLGLVSGLASLVWIPTPVVVVEAGFTYLVCLDARGANGTHEPMGMGYFSSTGYSQRRMGYYRSAPNAGFWSNLGAGAVMAMSVGTAAYVQAAELDERAGALEIFKNDVERVIARAPQSVAAQTGENEFPLVSGRYSWAIGVVGGLDVAAGQSVDGVTIPVIVDASTTHVVVSIYARPRGAAWEAQAPGAVGDVLIGSEKVTAEDLGLVPGAPNMASANFPVPRFTIQDSTIYYLVIEALNGTTTRVPSAITYHNVTGLHPDQYRKFWRSGAMSSWSNAASSITFRLAYDFTLTGYQLQKPDASAALWLGDTITESTARWRGETLVVGGQHLRSGKVRSFYATLSIAAVSAGSVSAEPLTLRPAGGAAKTWSYLRDRLAHACTSAIVVKDAVTGALLTRDTDYWVIPAMGCFSLPGTSGASRSVSVSYSWKARRYDLVVYTPLTGVVSVVRGQERVRDAGEFVPMPALGQLPLFVIDVEAKVLLPVWDNTEGSVKRCSLTETAAEVARNRRILWPALLKLSRGQQLTVMAYGDSNFAQMGGAYSLAAVRASANTVFHDRAKDGSGLLVGSPYAADVLASIPVYDNGDGAGTVHTRYGLVWELIRDIESKYRITPRLRNRSIPGTTSTNATYQGLDVVRLAAAVADVALGDLVVIGFGQNELGQASTRENVVAICEAFQAVGAVVMVVGCFRPNANDLHTQHTNANWRFTQRALREAAHACGAAYISTEVLYDDAVAGALGLSANDFCAGTFDVHPGPAEIKAIGKRITSWLL